MATSPFARKALIKDWAASNPDHRHEQPGGSPTARSADERARQKLLDSGTPLNKFKVGSRVKATIQKDGVKAGEVGTVKKNLPPTMAGQYRYLVEFDGQEFERGESGLERA